MLLPKVTGIFEIDLNVMNDMSQMAAILVKMRMPDSVSLQDLISA
jgi:hypothetical protein